jgi:hypothetical protein
MADIFQDVAGTGSVSSATWKGTALTKATSTRSVGIASELWYLSAPSTGSGTLSVTVTGATDAIKLGAVSFIGVATSSALDVSSIATGTTGNPSINVTTATSSDLIVATLYRYSTSTATTNRNSIYKDNTIETFGAGSYQLATSSGSYSDTYNGSVTQDWSMVAAAFKAKTTLGSSGGSSTSTYTYAYDNNGNLLSNGNATNTWNYRNQLIQFTGVLATSSYAYDYQGDRVKLVESGITTVFPTKFYNTALNGASTTVKHIFANGLLIATIQNGSSTTGGGGGSSTSTPTLDATSTLLSAGFNAGPVTMTSTLTLAGSSTIIVLNADIFQDVGGTGSIATATWKGVALKKIGGTREVNIATEQWYLAPTSTGSGTLSVTVSGATDDIKLNAASFTGVATSSPVDASSTAIGASGNPSVSVTTATSLSQSFLDSARRTPRVTELIFSEM